MDKEKVLDIFTELRKLRSKSIRIHCLGMEGAEKEKFTSITNIKENLENINFLTLDIQGNRNKKSMFNCYYHLSYNTYLNNLSLCIGNIRNPMIFTVIDKVESYDDIVKAIPELELIEWAKNELKRNKK